MTVVNCVELILPKYHCSESVELVNVDLHVPFVRYARNVTRPLHMASVCFSVALFIYLRNVLLPMGDTR
jgi:hypothetical protein